MKNKNRNCNLETVKAHLENKGEDIKSLLMGMLEKNPELRLSAAEVASHPYLSASQHQPV